MFVVSGNSRSILGTGTGPGIWICSACTRAGLRKLRQLPQQQRQKTTLSKDVTLTQTPLAEALSRTGVWNYGRWAKKDGPKKRLKGDKYRVNIVSDALCDDILTYLKPTLQRHTNCDILDIYPGAGLWSSKLHEVLQPRSHILLEPDKNIYTPFLQDLLDKPNTTLVPKSGIVWRDLSSVLDVVHLPHQTERLAGTAAHETMPQRNDTLLVTANLAFYPKRRYSIFESLTQLVLYQFISSIRASSLFHKYGLVRMLLWVEGADRHSMLARSCQRRKRLAIDAELATDWITEIAGPDDYSQWFIRDHNLDLESCRRALNRMAAAGLTVPAGRETRDVRELLEFDADTSNGAKDKIETTKAASKTKVTKSKTKVSAGDKVDVAAKPAVFSRPFKEELKDLEARFAAGMIKEASTEHKRLLQLQYRNTRENKVAESVNALILKRDALAAAYRSGGEETAMPTATDAVHRRESKWNKEIEAVATSTQKEFLLCRDNLHLFRQDPPVLAWDRRAVEPLVVRDTEFFPNAPCALLDIQPKAMHPLLRAMGPGSSRSGDVFELVLRSMMAAGAEPVSRAIDTVWPGAAEGVLPHCPSLYDTKRGGCPVGGPFGELSARTLNEQQWVEILSAWMKWPFRPTLSQLIARISEDGDGDTDDGVGRGGGGGLLE